MKTKLLPLLPVLLLAACARSDDAINPTAGLVTFALLCAVPWILSLFLAWAIGAKRIRWHKPSVEEEE